MEVSGDGKARMKQAQELPKKGRIFLSLHCLVLPCLHRLQIVSVRVPPNKGDVELNAINKAQGTDHKGLLISPYLGTKSGTKSGTSHSKP